jgi:hypothetical protein
MEVRGQLLCSALWDQYEHGSNMLPTGSSAQFHEVQGQYITSRHDAMRPLNFSIYRNMALGSIQPGVKGGRSVKLTTSPISLPTLRAAVASLSSCCIYYRRSLSVIEMYKTPGFLRAACSLLLGGARGVALLRAARALWGAASRCTQDGETIGVDDTLKLATAISTLFGDVIYDLPGDLHKEFLWCI